MRQAASMVALLVLAACGGGTADGGNKMAPPPPPSSGAMMANHVVQMVESRFDPVDLTIRTGDVVEFKGVSGGVHNVVFDTIPAGAHAAIAAGISDKADSVSTNMVSEGASVMVSFKDAPAGVYHFVCMPHMANGMRGTITVTP